MNGSLILYGEFYLMGTNSTNMERQLMNALIQDLINIIQRARETSRKLRQAQA